MEKKYTLSEIANLVENFRIMQSISNEHILKECADAIRNKYTKCFICDGTGQSDWQGKWKYSYKKKKSIWINVENPNGICPECDGTGKVEITVEKLRKLQEYNL